MIGFLKGRIAAKNPPTLVLDVNGVGYELEVPMSSFYALGELEDEARLLTHLHVREDAMLLYGFATETERGLFKELIKVNGIGAKMAIGILSAMSADEFVGWVEVGDVSALTKIPGVGKKTAERLVIEMRDRLKSLGTQMQPSLSTSVVTPKNAQSDAVKALVALGYKPAQAEQLVQKVPDDLTLEDTIKQALQLIKL